MRSTKTHKNTHSKLLTLFFCFFSLMNLLACMGLDDADNTCVYSFDFVCDDPSGTGLCSAGTDSFDCGSSSSSSSCPYTNDGVCDEGSYCPAGSDEADCGSSSMVTGSGSGSDADYCTQDSRYSPYGDVQLDSFCQLACVYKDANMGEATSVTCQEYESFARAVTQDFRPCPACP